MRKFTLFFVLGIIITFALQNCGENAKPEMTPIQYNDYIIGNQSKIIKKFITLSKTFNNHVPKEMDDELNSLQIQVDSAVTNISNLDGFKGNTEFKNAALMLFKFYQDAVKKEFKEMIDILKKNPDAMTSQDMQKMTDLNQSISSREKILDEAFGKAQNNFATQFKIDIKPNQLQNEIDKMGK